jgi:hypothetical protein
MERELSRATVLGGAAGIAAVVLLATLVLAAPHLGHVGPTNWGGKGHSPSLPNRSDDGLWVRVAFHSGCDGVPCIGPLRGFNDGASETPRAWEQDPGADLAFANLEIGGRNESLTPDPADEPIRSPEDFAPPKFFTGVDGNPVGFLGPGPPPTPVPEPAAWALLLLGLAAVGADLRSRHRSEGVCSRSRSGGTV